MALPFNHLPTPLDDSDDDSLQILGETRPTTQQALAAQSTSNDNDRPRQPSPHFENGETTTADRPAKRRRAENTLPSSSSASGRDSPLFVTYEAPPFAPSPIQTNPSGSGFAAPDRGIPPQDHGRPNPPPATAAGSMWSAPSPASRENFGLWHMMQTRPEIRTSAPRTSARSGSFRTAGTRSQPIEIELGGDEDDDTPVIVGSSDDDPVIIASNPRRLATEEDDDDDIVIVQARSTVPESLQRQGAEIQWRRNRRLPHPVSEVAASYRPYAAETVADQEAEREHEERARQAQAMQQRQRRELQERQQKEALSKSAAQQEEAYDGPPTLKRLTCVICMDVPTDLTAAACGHVFCHTCLMEALIASENRQRVAYEPKKSTCPVCRKNISRTKDKDVVPLLMLKKQRAA